MGDVTCQHVEDNAPDTCAKAVADLLNPGPCVQVMTRSDTGDMTCQCVEDKVPGVWASSQACLGELGDHLVTVRTAVSSCCGHCLAPSMQA